MDTNSMLDITKSVEDIKYLDSKGFDTSELMDYFTGKTKKVECKSCTKYKSLYQGCDQSYMGCELSYPGSYCDSGYQDTQYPPKANRHGLCADYDEITEEWIKAKEKKDKEIILNIQKQYRQENKKQQEKKRWWN
jgi:hypothetical protein